MEIRRLSLPSSRGITSLSFSLSLSLMTASFCSSNSGELRRSGKERWKTGRWERERRDIKWKVERRKTRRHRVSDKIQRARSGSSLLFLLLFLFLFVSFSLTPALSLLSIARVSLLSPLSRHSFLHLARTRCTFFSDSFLRYSAALNGPLVSLSLSSADRRGSDPGRRSSVFSRFHRKPFESGDTECPYYWNCYYWNCSSYISLEWD